MVRSAAPHQQVLVGEPLGHDEGHQLLGGAVVGGDGPVGEEPLGARAPLLRSLGGALFPPAVLPAPLLQLRPAGQSQPRHTPLWVLPPHRITLETSKHSVRRRTEEKF